MKKQLAHIRKHAARTYTHTKTAYENFDRKREPSLSVKEQMFFFKRLAFLIRAGVPILESLHMLGEQALSRRYGRVLGSITADVENGASLARALGRFPRIFGEFGINIIKIGESSGTLSQNLEYLADELGKRHELSRRIASAFVYPAVITVATLAITGFLMIYLFPKIMPVFASLHVTLPLTTRIVIFLSNFLVAWGLLLIVVIIAACIGCTIALRRSERLRFVFDAMLLRAPVLGEMFTSYNLASGTRTLGLLLKSGLTLGVALPLAADTTRNLVYREKYRALAGTVDRGERISTYLFTEPKLFPLAMAQMVAVGERSGNLSNALVYLSELYENDVEDFTKNLSSLIEPALMILMGLLVGFIAVSIITPIYGITQNLHP